MMKAAYIPPIPELGNYKHEGFHLLLAHLFEYPDYLEYYKKRAAAGDYLVLDNSAHEHGAGAPVAGLLDLAMEVGAKEIVIPDVLFDAAQTVERAARALRDLAGPLASQYKEAGTPKLMLVPQGQDRRSLMWCFRHLLELHQKFRHSSGIGQNMVVGLSKDYDTYSGGLAGLIEEFKSVSGRDRMELHCLGWPNQLWSIANVARLHPWVRSTDSAQAFVYAKNHILLEPGGWIEKYPRRDPAYFEEGFTPRQREIAERNALVFTACARNQLV